MLTEENSCLVNNTCSSLLTISSCKRSSDSTAALLNQHVRKLPSNIYDRAHVFVLLSIVSKAPVCSVQQSILRVITGQSGETLKWLYTLSPIITPWRDREHHGLWGKRECMSQSVRRKAVTCCLWNAIAFALIYVPTTAVVTCKTSIQSIILPWVRNGLMRLCF